MVKVSHGSPACPNFDNSTPVVCLAYSARALAESARQSGLCVIALDAFADTDTRRAALDGTLKCDWSELNRPDQIQAIVDTLFAQHSGVLSSHPGCVNPTHSCPPIVLLGGGLENYPDLLAALDQAGLHADLSVSQLGQLRNLANWDDWGQQSGIPLPPTSHKPPEGALYTTHFSQLPLDASRVGKGEAPCLAEPRQWLRKSLRSAGGTGIQLWPGDSSDRVGRLPAASQPGTQFAQFRTHRENHTPPPDGSDQPPVGIAHHQRVDTSIQLEAGIYWQNRIAGISLGAYCVLDDDRSRLLGVCRSLAAEDWAGPSEFIYRGSWGPIELAPEAKDRIECLAERVRCDTGLRGWLQLDLIQSADGHLWLLEINPRWTAGMEVLLRSGVANPVTEHCLACGRMARFKAIQEEIPGSRNAEKVRHADTKPTLPTANDRWVAKAVWYAPTNLTLSEALLEHISRLDFVADIPAVDTAPPLPTPIEKQHIAPDNRFADCAPSATIDVAAGQPVLTLFAETTRDEWRSAIAQKQPTAGTSGDNRNLMESGESHRAIHNLLLSQLQQRRAMLERLVAGQV